MNIVNQIWKVKGMATGALLVWLLSFSPLYMKAQVGEYRTDLAFGINGGYIMSSLSFVPEIPQDKLGGIIFGVTGRYTCEKYFNSICAIVGEVNLAQTGWKESILTTADEPVPILNPETGEEMKGTAEAYSRRTTYIQIPVLARLGWGRERSGLQAFFQLGPQIGFNLSESTESNFDYQHPEKYKDHWGWNRTSPVINQYTMPLENKFDYGIVGGGGIELSIRKVGHIIIDARYYYGLGNIYGNTKRDYFARSNFQNIAVKLTYLFDIVRTKNDKIK